MADNHLISFAIPTGRDDLTEKLEFALEHRLGLEIAAFATGPALQGTALRKTLEADFAAALRDFPHPLSYHGAYVDLCLHSDDPAIAAVARDRIERDLETAARLGCRLAVFHTGFNPLVPVARYEEDFVERHAAFWPRLAEGWPGLTLCLENLWEPEPRLFQALLRRVHHERVRLCLDVAHAHVHGHYAAADWLEQLAPLIAHQHWNDNLGDRDSHLPVGQGNIPWPQIMAATRALPRPGTVVLELRTIEALRHSLRQLGAQRIAPPADHGELVWQQLAATRARP